MANFGEWPKMTIHLKIGHLLVRTVLNVQVHAMSVQQTLGQLSLLLDCCVNVAFLLLIFLDALEDAIIKLRFFMGQTDFVMRIMNAS